MLTVPLLKFFCLPELEDHVAVAIMLTTAPYFLFFCRFIITQLSAYCNTLNNAAFEYVLEASRQLDHSLS